MGSSIWSIDHYTRSQIQFMTAGAAIALTGYIFGIYGTRPTRGSVLESPRKTLLPRLTEDEKTRLPYPPDVFPGARDVDSPYGSLRVYEFGPEEGRKVLLVHGISTPCLALGGVAHGLVERGCRVMLFDLPGRGYSDTPADIDHDVRLFVSCILIVLASSKLSWMGEDAFSIVGYSLGGGISAAFTSYFPGIIKSVVLVAPAGLIRDRHISRKSRMLYAKETVFEPLLLRIVRKRLMKTVPEPKGQNEGQGEEKADAMNAVTAEINFEANQRVVLSREHPDITIEEAVNHQVINHGGFVPAFMSSIRYGPIQRQHELWRKLGRDLKAKDREALIILGERDPIIDCPEVQEDARDVLDGRVKFIIMSAGHEAPVKHGPEVAEYIWDFWKEQ